MIVATTERTRLRWMQPTDAKFILRLLNEPSWLEQIGDKGVRNEQDAIAYMESGPCAMYQQFGHGLNLVEQRASAEPIGICGLLRRPTLPHPDLGFALLPEYWGQGYAFEAATATLAHAKQPLGVRCVLAIALPSNRPSIRLLERLGFVDRGQQDPDDAGTVLSLYEKSL
ncbi:MAG: GNAT family N-acetyltransferase [Planctomycetota bacterium]